MGATKVATRAILIVLNIRKRGARAISPADEAADMTNLGVFYYENAELDKACTFFNQALAVYRKLAARNRYFLTYLGNSLRYLGVVSKAKGELSRAKSLFSEAASVFQKLSSRDVRFFKDLVRVLIQLGEVCKMQKDYDSAVQSIEKAILLKDTKGISLDPVTVISAETSLAEAYIDMGKVEQAESCLRSGELLFGELQDRPFLARSLKESYALLRKRLAKSRS